MEFKHFLPLFALLTIVMPGAMAQRKTANAFRKPIQEAIQRQLDKDKEEVQIHLDSIREQAASSIEFTEDDVLIGQRLKRMQQVIPLEYNHYVKAYLDKYTSRNYKPYIEKLLGLGAYYFPIYDQIFTEAHIPLEVKYLSVVESSLDPHTLSSSGALGPWQFIYSTARIYDLAMDGLIDERKDVYSSTYAVSRYLSEAFNEFNDWLLALASYNCGRGCVRRAIQRSGMSHPTFWELSPYLPQQTQNYIPKYIAMSYILHYADQHGLNAVYSDLESDYQVVMVERSVDLSHVAHALDCSVDLLKTYNPAFKKQLIPGTGAQPRRLILPETSAKNDSLLYLALHTQQLNLPYEERNSIDVMWYTIKRGETIVSIAQKYKVSVQELMRWNGLNAKSSLIAGNTLEIRNITTTADDPVHTRLATAPTEKIQRSKPTAEQIFHVVRKGDTLSGIATKYKGATVSKLKADNNIRNGHLSIGQKLKVT